MSIIAVYIQQTSQTIIQSQEWLLLELEINFQSLGLRLEKFEEDLTLYTLKFSVEWVPITI